MSKPTKQPQSETRLATTNRRQFMQGAIGAGVGVWVSTRSARASASPNEKLAIAGVGIGGRGANNIEAMRGEHLVALCDVDEARGSGAFKIYRKAEKFHDYRRMFDKMAKSIDAVVVSTPDHMHAPITLAAFELGKHVYCEKPLTHTVAEARRVGEAARKAKLVTQMGNGGNGQDGARTTVEMLRAGVIGEVREVHAWSDRPGRWWKQALDRPEEKPPVPASLDWDLWLGVAPARPYHPVYHPVQWRGWYDFGTGPMGDMACHICNVAFWALELRDPTVIEAQTAERFEESFPAWSIIRWEYPRPGRPEPLEFFWYDGGKTADPELVDGHPIVDNGMIFVGDKGRLYCPSPNGSNAKLLPEKDFEGYTPPEPTIRRVGGKYHQEWIDAVKAGKPAEGMSAFPDRAAVMTECLLLGNLAVKTGKRIEWDARQMKVTNNVPEAQAMIDPPYRTGW